MSERGHPHQADAEPAETRWGHLGPEEARYMAWVEQHIERDEDLLELIQAAQEKAVATFESFKGDLAGLRQALLDKYERGAGEHGSAAFQPGVADREQSLECLDMIGWEQIGRYVAEETRATVDE